MKTTKCAREERGFDAGKKVKGRKRHILVDTLGRIHGLLVHPANIQERAGAKLLLEPLRDILTRMKKILADGGYSGPDMIVVGSGKVRLDIRSGETNGTSYA